MPSIRHSLKINLRDLVDPRGAACGGLWGTNPGVAFEVYRWMIATAAGYRDSGRWGETGPWEYLFLHPSCVNHRPEYQDGIGGPDWAATLRRAFQHAILCDDSWCPAMRRWRAALDLNALQTISVPIRHYRPAAAWGAVCRTDAFTSLMSLAGRFTTSPNSCHPRAKTLYRAAVFTHEAGHAIRVEYGYARDRLSSWYYTLAVQAKAECFDDFANRAIDEAARLIEAVPAKGE